MAKLTKSQINQIVNMVKIGHLYRDICAAIPCVPSTVHYHASRAGVARTKHCPAKGLRRGRKTHKNKHKAIQMLSGDYKKLICVALECGIGVSTACMYKAELNEKASSENQ